ncbi:MAG: isoprenoid biosynthesis glyoxalase ElbB [Deltaproteobacteria bacterium]|nr:isoprenoid biosynthesis glyoxalase ElbB [Deltaproteobacteria bacterium]
MSNKRVAVILAGCGHQDGAEVHESVCTLLAIDRAGAKYQIFAPDKNQHDVMDHVAKKPVGEKRNVLTEAGRIARGNVKPLSTLSMADYDALVLPGGFGAAKNLIDYGVKGAKCGIDADMERVLKEARTQNKPIGAICIAPVIVARALGADHHPTLTIGKDAGTAGDLEKMGAKHQEAPPDGIVVDEANRVVSTPAYMSATRITEVSDGITKLVERVLAF